MTGLRMLPPLALALGFVLLCRPLAAPAAQAVTDRARQFVEDHTKRLRPLEVAAALAWWNANTTGKKEDFDKKIEAQNRIDEALANADAFKTVKGLKEHRQEIDDPVVRRAIDVLYLTYLEKQVDKELLKQMVTKSNAVEERFNKFRARVDGKEMTDNQLRDVLKTATDSARLKAV